MILFDKVGNWLYKNNNQNVIIMFFWMKIDQLIILNVYLMICFFL